MFQHVFQCSAGHGGTEECCALCSLFLLTTQKRERAIDSNVGWERGRVSISTSANGVLPSCSDQAINLDLLMDGVSSVRAKSERRCC